VNTTAGVELSVIVATHNRRELLRRCLKSLTEQTQDPASFEVIVADDGSEDGTAEMAESLDTPHALKVLHLAKSGKVGALNAAIEEMAGSVCLFLDDDIVASPGLVAAHLTAYREEPKALGIGALTQSPPAGRDWFGRAHAKSWNERYDGLASRQPDWPDCYGGNFSAPRESLRKVGGFASDLEAIEDIELGYRLCEAGCRPLYLSEARGIHDDQKSRNRILADMSRFGSFCAEFVERLPATRSKLLGWFLDTTPREVMLRRLLLTLRVEPRTIAPLGALVPGVGRRQIWFGFVSRYAFWRGARAAMSRKRWLQTTRGVPVLMYHAFTDSGERDRYVLSSRSFARQMRLLSLLRRRVISFDELAGSLREGQPLPPRAVVLTIDDGYRDNFELAYPILRRHRFPATIFLVSQRLGAHNDWGDKGAVAGRPILAIDQVKQMAADGIRFGAHTRSHCRLPEADDGALVDQIDGSREDLEAALGGPIETFAYPYGRYDERAVASVGEAGFAAACTIEGGLAKLDDDPFLVPRIEVRGSDSTVRLLGKIWLGRT